MGFGRISIEYKNPTHFQFHDHIQLDTPEEYASTSDLDITTKVVWVESKLLFALRLQLKVQLECDSAYSATLCQYCTYQTPFK